MKLPTYTELLDQLDALHEEAYRDIEISDPRVSLIYRTAAVMEQLRAYAAKAEGRTHGQEGECIL